MNPDYRDMLSALSDENVDFLVVGAYALAVHGFPRATGDMDLWIRPSPQNAKRALGALRRFGSPLDDLSADDLSRPGTVFQIGVTPRRIDLLTALDGVSFDEAWAGRTTVRIDDLTIPVIGKPELIRNKRATGRRRDLADAEQLEAAD